MSQLVWLITGCSSGFGEIFVHQILSRGDLVIATGRKLEKLEHLKQAGAATLQLDITDKQQALHEIIQKALAIYGRIDVLVNNAGYVSSGVWEDLDRDQLLDQFDTNVFGTVAVTREVLPHFRQRKSGTVVFIGSLSGWYGEPFISAYVSSKFALEGLVEGLRSETEQLGIKTLLIEPGRFRTNLLSSNNLKTVQSEIPEYVELSLAGIDGLTKGDQMQPGDPEKAVKVILDLVRNEGYAKDKKVPLRLPLGTDCYKLIKEKCEETLKILEEWEDVITGTDFDK